MFFDRHQAGERALLVHCQLTGRSAPKHQHIADINSSSGSGLSDNPLNSAESSLTDVAEEFVELVRSAAVSPVYLATVRLKFPAPRFFIGSGKVAELVEIVCDNEIDVVLFDQQLSPSQERNLEAEFQCKVLDRTGLILDIFAQRARSHAGKLQVELAQLEHISTRLVRGWTHLERQKGGIGMRGPGESQLETDRRLLRERIKWINKRLDKVNLQRQQGRKARSRAELPTVALVGYTNAGKSTLFNTLTQADVYAEDQLFATLDTTLRAVELPAFGKVIVADTVGFVRDLPHKLVEAFKATLEEASEADLLLHVVDASSEEFDEQIQAVDIVLKEIGASEIPILQVMNKIDLLDDFTSRTDYQVVDGSPYRVWLSAKDSQGFEYLTAAIAQLLGGELWRGVIVLAPAEASLRAQLFNLGAVVSEIISERGEYQLTLCYRKDMLQRLFSSNNHALPEGLI